MRMSRAVSYVPQTHPEAVQRKGTHFSPLPAFLPFLLLFLLLFPLSGRAQAEKRIGVLLFSELSRYVTATKGFTDALKEAGFGPDRVQILRGEAGASKARAAELAEGFAAKHLDLIFTVGTHATLAVAQKIKDTPIVFAQVYDPVETGIALGWKSSGNNTTGVSAKFAMSKIIGCLKQFAPTERLGVLYTPGEKNSEAQLRDLQEAQAQCAIKIIPAPLSKIEDLSLLLPLLMRSADALCITGSNLVDSRITAITEMTTRARVPTITHLEDMVEQGVLLGVLPGSYANGHLAGRMAVKILLGAKPASIPIERAQNLHVVINMKTAKAGRFRIPPDFMKNSEKISE